MAKELLETDEGRAWLLMNATGRAAKEWESRLYQAKIDLAARCRQSSDPGVRDAYAKLETLEQIVKYLSGTK